MKAPATTTIAVTLVGAPDPTVIPREYGPRADRRRLERKQRLVVKHTVKAALTEDMIPPGSIMSEQTVEAIRAGQYELHVTRPPRQQNTPKPLTYQEKCRLRRKLKKLALKAG